MRDRETCEMCYYSPSCKSTEPCIYLDKAEEDDRDNERFIERNRQAFYGEWWIYTAEDYE